MAKQLDLSDFDIFYAGMEGRKNVDNTDGVEFVIEGSTGNEYLVEFFDQGDRWLGATCSCYAGAEERYCRHRIDLLLGKTDDLISDNPEDAELLLQAMAGTKLAEYIAELKIVEEELKTLQRKRIGLKHGLNGLFLGQREL